jgi:c-di-AMP phosphodiesterase-like protein
MKERRTCSKFKPWLYFSMELILFITIAFILSKVVGLYVSSHFYLLTGIAVVAYLLYHTQAIQRLERVLERTNDVRKVKLRERYEDVIVG